MKRNLIDKQRFKSNKKTRIKPIYFYLVTDPERDTIGPVPIVIVL